MRIKQNSFVFLLFFFCSCCNNYENRILEQSIAYLDNKPDSSLILLESIDPSSFYLHKDKARYNLYLSVALDKNLLEIPDSVITPAVYYFSTRGSIEERMLALYHYGLFQNNNNEYSKAIVTFERAAELAKSLNDTHYLGLIYRNMANSFSFSNNIQSAIQYREKELLYFSIDPSDSLFHLCAQYSLAVEYNTNKEYQKAHATLEEMKDSLNSLINDYRHALMADIELRLNDNPRACINMYKRVPEEYWNMFDYGCCGLAYEQIGQTDSSDLMYSEGYKACFDEADSATLDYSKSRVLFDRGDFKNAYLLLSHSTQIQDSLTRATLSESVSSAQRDFFMSEAAFQKQRAHSAKIRICCLIALFLLLMALVYAKVTRVNKEKEHLLKELMAKQAISEKDIHRLRDNQLSLISSYYSEKIRRIDRLTNDYFLSDSDHQKEIVFKQFKDSIKELNKQDFYNSLEDDLNRYNHNIVSRLREQVTSVRGRSLNITMLFFAGLSYETIAIITQSPSVNSLRVLKNRVKTSIIKSAAKDADFFLEMLEIKTPTGKNKTNEKQN